MNRSSDISSKLGYAKRQWQQLINETFRAKKERVDATDIIYCSSHILSEVRECYDYCANDIVDEFIVPHTCNQETVRKYQLGKLKVYFPFYGSQLKRKDSVWRELQYSKPSLHKHLLSLCQRIAHNSQIPKTDLRYGNIPKLIDMVNEKKHDRLLAIKSEKDQEILVDGEHIKMVIPLKEQIGKVTFYVEPGASVSLVSEFVFEFNKAEVTYFCQFAITSTEVVLNEIYTAFFNSPLISP